MFYHVMNDNATPYQLSLSHNYLSITHHSTVKPPTQTNYRLLYIHKNLTHSDRGPEECKLQVKHLNFELEGGKNNTVRSLHMRPPRNEHREIQPL